MTAVYNDNEPFVCDWLEDLITHGHIAPGRVDRRSISDLTPADVAGDGQRHFFAGIGGWSHALRLAGVPDDAPVWTGSCPCQPFSDAGTGSGTSDPRHLWPAWFALIRQCRPPIIFGEQVASAAGLEWLDAVFADMERCGYSVGAADLCAASVGAPHIRQRLFFVAYAAGGGRREGDHASQAAPHGGTGPADRGGPRGMANPDGQRVGRGRERGTHRRSPIEPAGRGHARRVADSSGAGLEVVGKQQARRQRAAAQRGGTTGIVANSAPGRRSEPARPDQPDPAGMRVSGPPGATRGFWHPADWILCRDPSGGPPVARPVEPTTFPLAARVPQRVGLLSGYGNAIVPQVAAEFIKAALEAIGGMT